MSETSCAWTVTAPLVTSSASTSLLPLMLASTALPMRLVAATALSATLIDTPPRAAGRYADRQAESSDGVVGKGLTVTAPLLVATVESSMVAVRLPPMLFSA